MVQWFETLLEHSQGRTSVVSSAYTVEGDAEGDRDTARRPGGVLYSGVEQRLGQQGTQDLDSSSPRQAVQNEISAQHVLHLAHGGSASLEPMESISDSGAGCKMQLQASPFHHNAHQKQVAQHKERMTGSSPVSPDSSSTSPASSPGTSPAHPGCLANDSLDGPGAFASPKLQPRGAVASCLYAPDLAYCNQTVKGQPWDKTHAEIAEQAKHEANIEHRIAELRREGLWSSKRLNRVQEAGRPKSHWDYLCEEMQWLSSDFAQERRWKRGVARKVARTVLRFHEEQRQKEERAKREEQAKLRRIASTIAKDVKHFWANVEKVVQFKQQSRLEEKRKKALDLQLDFIVGQTEKYSDLLSQSLNESLPASKPGSSQLGSSLAGSAASSPPVSGSATEDEDFEPHEEEDDEETIEVEEKQAGNDAETRRREIEQLRRESELPLEELLRSLPRGRAGDTGSSASGGSDRESSPDQPPKSSRTPQNARRLPERRKGQRRWREELEDEEFTADEDEGEDEEDTIDAEEELAGDVDHKAELDDLTKESVLPVADLLRRYTAVYSDSFETPESDSQDSSDSEDTEEEEEEEEEEDDETTEDDESSSSTGTEDSTPTEEDESDEEEEEEEEEDAEEEIGVEYLLQCEPGDGEPSRELAQADAKGPKKEITDIAAAAESLQPKGYTLATTQVKTPVPSLLRGTLREYQHIGLDWLVTMYEKKLNGILADEMGLGKTIQTIALLAHLAIEKGNWGPHLVIVPTSVILNWEIEFKRWCPSFKILTYYGVQKERKMKRQGWTKPNAFHVCITSYKLVLQDHQAFRRKNWKYMILDEAQNIKNFKSQRWQSLLNFNSQRRLLLTGTPLQNSLMELWSLMHFLMPHVFQSHREFKEWFSNPLTGMIEGSQEYNENLVKRLHKVLRPFLLRRIKADVEKQMPKKYEHVVQCRLSKRQRYLYDDFMSQASTRETLETGHFMSVINILMQLRKVCNHPNLFDPRPIHSPFITRGICYTTASCVLRALEHQPFKQVDLSIFDLINIEGKLSKYEAEVFLPKKKVTKKLIVEISEAPDPPPRPRPVRMKVNRMFQPAQKPDGRTVVLVNSPRPPLPVPQHNPSPLPSLRPPGSGVAEMLHTVQTTTTLHPVVNPVAQAVVPSQGLPTPLTLSHVVTSAPRPILSAPRPHVPPVAAPHLPGAGVRPLPLSAVRVTTATLTPGTIGNLVTPAPVQGSQHLTGFTVPGAATAIPQRFILSPDMQARLPTGEVVSIGQLASLANRQGQATQGSKPVTFQIQGNKLTLAGTQIRQVAVGQPRQVQGNVVHLVSTSGHHIIGQPAQLALIQAMAQQNAQATMGVQASLQTVAGPQSTISTAATASPGLTVPLTATQVPGSVMASSGVVKIVVRQAPKEGFPLAVHAPRPLAVSAARFPTVVTPARVQLPASALAVSGAHLSTAPRPVLRVVHAPALNAEQAAPTVTRLVVAGPTLSEKEDAELPQAPPLTSTSLAAQRPRRHPAPPPRSPFHLESLDQKRRLHRQERLDRILAVNERRCAPSPVYGSEVLRLCSLSAPPPPASAESPPEGGGWRGLGYAHCLAAQVGREARRPEAYWRTTRALDGAVRNPEDRIEELADIIDRFIFVIPPVEAPAIRMHVSHPHPSSLHHHMLLTDALHQQLSPRTARLHRTICNMRTQFPDLRLIQYDCGKLQVLDLLLRRLKTGGHRVLLFTQMTRMLDILEQFLNFHGHIYLRLDGSTRVEQRQILMDRFNADKRIFCFILSTRSGGVGVNLTGADTVLFYDSDWNPTMDAQAQDRCHRIGQTRDVHIYRLISHRTVEENILKKANQKRMLGDLAIEGGNFTTAFFKEQTIRELFDLPTEEPKKEPEIPTPPPPPPRPEEEDSMSAKQTQILEQALCKAEDEEDIHAASQAKAEQVAELAEFNENIPLDGEEGSTREEEEEELSKAEQEIAALVGQLTPIERYAMNYLEASLEAISKEELKQAEEQVEAARKDLDQAKNEVWTWSEEDERRLSEELQGRRQKKAPARPRPQGDRPSTRMSERLRGARLGAREAGASGARGEGVSLEAGAVLPKEMDGGLLPYEDSTRDLQIHISTELPDEIFEEEAAPPEEPEQLGWPLTPGERPEADEEEEEEEEGQARGAGVRLLANGRPDLREEPRTLETQPQSAARSPPSEATAGAAPESVTFQKVVVGEAETGGAEGAGEGPLPQGQDLSASLPTANRAQLALQDGGLAPNGLSLEIAEGQGSEGHAPGVSAAGDTGSQRSEEHVQGVSVATETENPRSEEPVPEVSVVGDTGSQRSEEPVPGVSVAGDTGSRRSEEHVPGVSDTASQRSEERIPNDTGAGLAGDLDPSSNQPTAGEMSREPPEAGGQSTGEAEEPGRGGETEEPSKPPESERPELDAEQTRPESQRATQESQQVPPETERPAPESERKQPAADREVGSPAAAAVDGQLGVAREKRRRRTADQELLRDQRGGSAADCSQVAATILRKVPGRINVVVERREPARRARRPPGPRGEEAGAQNPAPPPSGPAPGCSGPSADSGSEGTQDRARRRPRPPQGSESSSSSGEEPDGRESSGLVAGGAPAPASRDSQPSAPPAPRSTRQRPGDLVPPLERKRYRPRQPRAEPSPSEAAPSQVGGRGHKRRRGAGGGDGCSIRASSPSSSSSSSTSSSSSSSSPPDRVLRSLSAAVAAAATTPAANTRSSAGGSPLPPPPPSAKRKGRPPSSSRSPPPPPPPPPPLPHSHPGRGRPSVAKKSCRPAPPPPPPPPGTPTTPRRGRPPNPHPKRGRPPNPPGQPPRRRGRPPSSSSSPPTPKRRGRPPSAGLGSERPGRKSKT